MDADSAEEPGRLKPVRGLDSLTSVLVGPDACFCGLASERGSFVVVDAVQEAPSPAGKPWRAADSTTGPVVLFFRSYASEWVFVCVCVCVFCSDR